MTFDELVDRLKDQFGDTGLSQSTIVAILNERTRRMIADARWRQSQQQIATTIAGTNTYALPGQAIHVSDLKVGSQVYEWAPESDLWRIQAGDTGFWFSLLDDSTGTTKLQLWPTPSTTGDSITAQVVLLPTDMAYGASATPGVPADIHSYLLAGARSDLYREVDERPDLAQVEEQVYTEGVQKLRARRFSLVGPRITRIRVGGKDFPWP